MKPSVSNRRTSLALFIFLPAALLLILPFTNPGEVSNFLLWLGRFHPVMLHFPIVLIILALVLEILRRTNLLRKADLVISIILVAAAVSTLVAIASGYLLYASGDYSGTVLERHLWIGVITGVCILCTVAFFFLYHYNPGLYIFYLGSLLVANAAVAYTSHLGGALTHGEDYLTEYIPLITAKNVVEKEKDPSEMMVYDDMIVPVFESKCVSCHNSNRAKGEFVMTSFDDMLRGGESENKGIIAGNADSSEVYKRIVLPEGHDDRMPPEGKTPLTSDETALLYFWINSGASTQQRVEDVKSDSAVGAIINDILPDLKRYRRKQEIARLRNEQLERDLENLAFKLNIIIERDSASDDDLFTVQMKFPPAPFNSDQLHELAPYKDVFSRLSLVACGIEDDGLYHIAQMSNVKELYLQKTRLNGSGLVHLKNMEKLEVLNLSYTNVDDKSAIELLKIPNLREVYLFQSKTSPEVANALQEYKPTLKIYLEEGPYF